MKKKPNDAIRALRKIIGQTQADFAATIGVSKDAVVSWETGRNQVSDTYARRIALTTGVDKRTLLKRSGPLLTQYTSSPQPYTRAEFDRHQQTFWGKTPEENVRLRLQPCADTLELLFLAAARSAAGASCSRLPGVLDSFLQWCQQARADFELEPEIEAELGQRKETVTLNKSYAGWREMAKTDPTMAKLFGFKDDPKKSDAEMLELSMRDTVPVWQPGQSMRARKTA